jgi:hypothetical protein
MKFLCPIGTAASLPVRDIAAARSCLLTQLDHCKATNSLRHEFLMAYFTLNLDGKDYRTCIIIDRCSMPPDVEEKRTVPKTTSSTSLISLPSTSASSRVPSPSPSPSSRSDLKVILGKGESIPALDHVIVPKRGQVNELLGLATQKFGSYDTLNTLFVDTNPISAPQIAILLDIVHNLAPNYTLTKHQCYWFSLIIFLVIRSQTRGREIHGERIVRRGKLFGLSPEQSAGDDEMVAEDEYKKAWEQFKVHHCLFYDPNNN